MRKEHSRISREKRTVAAMIRIFCEGRHGSQDGLCTECDELRRYALERLGKCPFQQGKTTCADCDIHCYRLSMRDRIRAVMQYSGPRMLIRHPVLAIYHVVDGLRKQPVHPRDEEPHSRDL